MVSTRGMLFSTRKLEHKRPGVMEEEESTGNNIRKILSEVLSWDS